MFRLRLPLCGALLAVSALSAVPVEAGNINSSMKVFGQNLSSADQQMLMHAVYQALDAGKAGASSNWSDDKTGHAGRATVQRVYQKGDMPCGTVEHVFTKGGGDRYELPFCRQPDGTWKIEF